MIWAFLGAILVLTFWFISLNNSLKSAVIKIDEAESGIDVALKKRYDLLTKAVDVVRGYAKHEQETLKNIVSIRQGASKQEIDSKLTKGFEKLNVLVENYPELKASENFSDLHDAINDVEEHLSASRRFYNAAVRNYNMKVQLFPSSVVANMLNMTEREFFEVDEDEKSDVKMSF